MRHALLAGAAVLLLVVSGCAHRGVGPVGCTQCRLSGVTGGCGLLGHAGPVQKLRELRQAGANQAGANQAGPAGPPTASYAYPYYTVRAPRDFLVDNPPPLGP